MIIVIWSGTGSEAEPSHDSVAVDPWETVRAARDNGVEEDRTSKTVFDWGTAWEQSTSVTGITKQPNGCHQSHLLPVPLTITRSAPIALGKRGEITFTVSKPLKIFNSNIQFSQFIIAVLSSQVQKCAGYCDPRGALWFSSFDSCARHPLTDWAFSYPDNKLGNLMNSWASDRTGCFCRVGGPISLTEQHHSLVHWTSLWKFT